MIFDLSNYKKIEEKYPPGFFLEKIFCIISTHNYGKDKHYWTYVEYNKYRNEYHRTIPLIYKDDEIGEILAHNKIRENTHKLCGWTHHDFIKEHIIKDRWILIDKKLWILNLDKL